MLVLGPRGNDGEYPRNKANIGNPKVNRDCPSLAANCTLADCMEITLGPSIQYIPLGVYRTGGFNAMKAIECVGKACHWLPWRWMSPIKAISSLKNHREVKKCVLLFFTTVKKRPYGWFHNCAVLHSGHSQNFPYVYNEAIVSDCVTGCSGVGDGMWGWGVGVWNDWT